MNNHYNPYEDYDEIIHPDVRNNLNKDGGNLIYGDYAKDEEFSDSGYVVVYLFIALFLMAITAIVYYLIL